jgi:hypothetical protein
MTVPVWPTSLPQNLIYEGQEEQFADMTERSSMEYGPDKVRKRTSSAVRQVGGYIVVTRTQLNALKDFFNTELLGGSLRFEWIDPTSDEESSSSYYVEMRFTAPPAARAEGPLFRVQLSLEILP